jgi:NAD+-dependent protein deacetylase SIR2
LLTNYTQNIDNIEANAGVRPEKIVQCHGSFASATCVKCHFKVPGVEIFDTVREGKVPECNACQNALLKPQGMKRKRSSNGSHKNRKRDEDSFDEDDYEIPTPGIMKVRIPGA